MATALSIAPDFHRVPIRSRATMADVVSACFRIAHDPFRVTQNIADRFAGLALY